VIGATVTEKILARHAGRERVEPGELVTCKVDLLMANDITAPLAIDAFRRTGATRIFDPARLAIVLSHFAPARDVRSAVQCAVARAFAKEHALPLFFDEGRGGIEHALLPDLGLIRPGQLILGADSHSCTYGALGAFATGVGSTDLGVAMALGETWLRVPETLRFRFHGAAPPFQSAKDLVLSAIAAIGTDGGSWKALEFCGPVIDALEIEGRLTLCNMAIEAGAKNGVIAADIPRIA
jgi:3-isopropylmalate/(R)-2-methylmalate dehydratase large subunit